MSKGTRTEKPPTGRIGAAERKRIEIAIARHGTVKAAAAATGIPRVRVAKVWARMQQP